MNRGRVIRGKIRENAEELCNVISCWNWGELDLWHLLEEWDHSNWLIGDASVCIKGVPGSKLDCNTDTNICNQLNFSPTSDTSCHAYL
jgi:hypothetical protein